MQDTDRVCLCFGVTLGKVRAFLARENPVVASLLSECLGAGTGCGWCVPYLKQLHTQHQQGARPDIPGTAQDYQDGRLEYRASGERPE